MTYMENPSMRDGRYSEGLIYWSMDIAEGDEFLAEKCIKELEYRINEHLAEEGETCFFDTHTGALTDWTGIDAWEFREFEEETANKICLLVQKEKKSDY